MSKSIHVFTDGACSGNHTKDESKRRAGWAFVFVGSHEHLNRSAKMDGSTEKITNNTAELNAIKAALETIKENGLLKETLTVHLHTDSSYSRDCLLKYAPGWKKNGWKKRDGPIKNLALIKSCVALLDTLGPRMVVSWTKGHATDESFEAKGNRLADEAANKARMLHTQHVGPSADIIRQDIEDLIHSETKDNVRIREFQRRSGSSYALTNAFGREMQEKKGLVLAWTLPGSGYPIDENGWTYMLTQDALAYGRGALSRRFQICVVEGFNRYSDETQGQMIDHLPNLLAVSTIDHLCDG